MFYDVQHPDVPLRDFQAFRMDFSPHRFAGVVDRSQLQLPEQLLPLARGGVIPSDSLQRKLGCGPNFRFHWTPHLSRRFQPTRGTSWRFCPKIRRSMDSRTLGRSGAP